MDYDKLINDIVWWIPIKNKRDNLRSELKILINNVIDEKNKIIEENNRNYDQFNKILDSINDKVININNELYNRFSQLKKEIYFLDIRNKARMQILSLGDKKIIEEKRKERLIVSLTSFPQRIYDIDVVLFSLLNQTVKPDKIILWLSVEEFPNLKKDVPIHILNMQKFGIDIEFCNNLHSYNKIIHALKKYPNDLIAVADDDIYYEYNWLEKLYKAYLENPSYIHCHRAHKMKFDKDSNVLPYDQWTKCINETDISFTNFITNVGGALYKSELLYKDIFNEKLFIKMCPKADDIWCWAMTVLNGTKINVVKDNISEILEIGYDHYFKLCYINVGEKFNDIQLNNVFHYYGNSIMRKINDELKKQNDNFQIKDQTRPDQTRPDQTRPDQTRPDQTRPDQTRPN